MSGNNTKYPILIRSRFQPFTKFHTEIIRQLIDRRDTIGIVIIRDYETVSRWHRISPRFKSVDLRHLPIFNPYTSWEVVEHVNVCLKAIPNSEHVDIRIIVVPVKFAELHEIVIMSSGENVKSPTDIGKFVELPEGCNSEIFKQCSMIENLGRLISIVSFDMMPRNFRFRWAFGIFDQEDKDDFNLAQQGTLGASKVPLSSDPPSYKSDLFELDLGLYGQIMSWIYLKFLNDYNSRYANHWRNQGQEWEVFGPNGIKSSSKVTNCIKDLESNLRKYVDRDNFTPFKKKVEYTLGEFLRGFGGINEAERSVLLDCTKFMQLAQSSIKFCSEV